MQAAGTTEHKLRRVARKHVIVHAGYHKTGTTSIQVALTNARERLRAAGILYPLCGVPKEFPYGQHLLPWSLMDRPPAPHFFHLGSRQELWRSLCDEIEASSASLVILSSEEFDRLSFAEISVLARLLSEYHIAPMIFLRSHAGLIESMYRTYVIHMGYSAPIARFAAEEAPRLDYANMLRDWAAIADQDLIVLSYEDERVRRDSIAAFFGAIDVNDEVLAESRSIRVNESVPAFVSETARHFRLQGVPEDVVLHWISEVRRIQFAASNDRFSCLPDWLRTELDGRFRIETAAIVSDDGLRRCLHGSLETRPLRYDRVVITSPLRALSELGYRRDPSAQDRQSTLDKVPCIGAIDEMDGTHARGWLRGAHEGAGPHVTLTFGGEMTLSARVDPRDQRFVLDLGSPIFRDAALRAMARRRNSTKRSVSPDAFLAERFGIAVEALSDEAGAPFQTQFVLPLPADFPAERTAREWLRFLDADVRDLSLHA